MGIVRLPGDPNLREPAAPQPFIWVVWPRGTAEPVLIWDEGGCSVEQKLYADGRVAVVQIKDDGYTALVCHDAERCYRLRA